jgi:hypothetical protein
MDNGDLTYIKIPYPNARDLQFKLIVPHCWLVISPSIGNAWATGRYVDQNELVPLSISHSGHVAQLVAVNAFAYKALPKDLPHMNLAFGRVKPFSLSIEAGDVDDHLDLGGLPLTALEIKYEAGIQKVNFSYPNPNEMKRMRLTADTGPVQIENMENANATNIRLNGDSTHYQLNFNGELKRNTTLHIGMSVSNVQISIPSGTAVKITSANSPISSHKDDFTCSNKTYLNGPARDHKEPLFSINNASSDGSLSIHTL